MSFFGDLANTAKDTVKDAFKDAKKTINDNIDNQINTALSNNRTTVKRPQRGYFSGLEAWGILERAVQTNLNTYINTMEAAYAVPVVAVDTSNVNGVVSPIGRYELRSGPYAEEYDSIISEFDIQV